MGKINLCIATSQQNNYCLMGDLEKDHCSSIAKKIYEKLSNDDRFNLCLVPLFEGENDVERLKKSTKWSNDFLKKYINEGNLYHLEIHTDGGYNGRGGMLLYNSVVGKSFGIPIMERLSKIIPAKKYIEKERKELYALKNSVGTAILIEVSFHDKIDEARFIHENIDKIAGEIVLGIYNAFNLNEIMPRVIYNGNEVKFSQPPEIKNGVMLVPLRALCEAMGKKVGYIEKTKTAVIDD